MEKQTFLKHIAELRGRIFWVVVVLLIGAGIGYYLYDYVLQILIQPLNQTLYYTKPGGGLELMLKICFLVGGLVAVPALLYHSFNFMSPLLKLHTKLFILYLTLSSITLLAIGVAFSYFIALPAALRFLMEFSTDKVQALITTDAYLSFVLVNLAIAALMFQLPIILIFIDRIKPLKPKKLLLNQHWVVLASFTLAAIATPTIDPINQCLIAVPIIVLYDLAVASLWIFGQHKKQPKVAVAKFVVKPPEPAKVPTQMASYEKQQAFYANKHVPRPAPVARSVTALPLQKQVRSIDGFSSKLLQRPLVQPRQNATGQRAPTVVPVMFVPRRRLIQL